jgi:pyrogallol hydroxytransferase large subunit-like protein
MTAIEFEEKEAAAGTWTINARGKSFAPPPQTTISPYRLACKSTVYSKDRLLWPMKRVDFDPNGARNPQNRGISGYVRISWDPYWSTSGGSLAACNPSRSKVAALTMTSPLAVSALSQ